LEASLQPLLLQQPTHAEEEPSGILFETQQQKDFLADKNIALPNAKSQHVKCGKKRKEKRKNKIQTY